MNYGLTFLSIFFSVIALLSVIWIIVPAPSYYIWLYSVAVSEWSLWLGGLALLSILGASANYALYKSGSVFLAVLIIGGIAFLISLYPFFSAFSVARDKNVSLSLGNYFNALTDYKPKIDQFKTYIFARHGETDLKLDVYVPPDKTLRGGASVIVIHGGSWSGGNRNDFPQWNVWLAANGFTVFDIDYRLAPQPNYLSAIGDVKCAVRWVKSHSAEFDIAPDKIALLGRSAGAHLALIAAYSAGDAALSPACPENVADESVRAVAAFYAPTDLIWDYDNPANQFVIDGPATLANFLGGNPHSSSEIRDRFLLASPVERVNSATPPTLLIHGGHDQLVRGENLDILADKLNKSNVSHQTLYIPYAQHGFDYNFNGWGSQITKPIILDFLIENTQDKNIKE